MATTSIMTVTTARNGLLDGVKAASTMLQGSGLNPYQLQVKTAQIEEALSAHLRHLGFGPRGGELQHSGLHQSVESWVSQHGVNPEPTIDVRVERGSNTIVFGALHVHFQRTLRIPDDGTTYPLPAGFGPFPLHHVADYEGSGVPDAWSQQGGVFLPMWQREALWINFFRDGRNHLAVPYAVMIGAGKINAVTGESWGESLAGDRQNYLVTSIQPWLDGFYAGKDDAGHDTIRQFVAMPLGMGYTAEAQLTGSETVGGLQFQVFAPTPETVLRAHALDVQSLIDRLPQVPPVEEPQHVYLGALRRVGAAGAMGMASGGRMRQQIFQDPYGGPAAWLADVSARLFVHIANATDYRAITGQEPPPSPITKHEYERMGISWFEYNDDCPTVTGSSALDGVQSLAAKDASHGFTTDAAAPVDTSQGPTISIDPATGKGHVVTPAASPDAVKDGEW